MKRAIQSVLVFWGIIALFPVLYLAYSYIIYRVDPPGDERITITTWLDTNANGRREAGEPPLAGVSVCSGARLDADPTYNTCRSNDPVTDEMGQHKIPEDISYCDTIYSFATAPEGYQPTTDVGVKGCPIQFGFVQSGVLVRQKVRSIDEFTRETILVEWIRRIGIGALMLIAALGGMVWLMKHSS